MDAVSGLRGSMMRGWNKSQGVSLVSVVHVELPSIHGVMDLSVVICTYMDLCSAIYLIR